MTVTSRLESVAPTIAPPVKTTAHLPYLDGVRGIAALTVCLGHGLGFRDNGIFTSAPWVFNFLHNAVALFIVLSGFCLMLPVSRNGGVLRGGAKAFFMRRARRILPPYYITVALSLILIRLAIGQKMGDTVWDYAVPVTKMGLLTHLLLVHDFSHPHEINGVLWSIAIEWQIYFLFPAMLAAVRRYGWPAFTTITVAVSYFVMLAGHHSPRFAAVNPQFVGLFALGMLGADIGYSPHWASLRDRVRWGHIAAALGALLIPLYGLIFRAIQLGHAAYVDLLDPLFGLFAVTLLVALSTTQIPPVKRMMEWRPLVWIGTISYSLYLIHLPLEALLWKFVALRLPLTNGMQCLCLTVVSALVIIPAAYAFYLGCEKPFIVRR